MRAPTFVTLSVTAALAAVCPMPAHAQLSGPGLNSTNRSFETQNQIRGAQQQQQFNANQNRMQMQRNELFRPQGNGPTVVVPPRR